MTMDSAHPRDTWSTAPRSPGVAPAFGRSRAFALAALFAVSALTGCSNDSSSTTPEPSDQQIERIHDVLVNDGGWGNLIADCAAPRLVESVEVDELSSFLGSLGGSASDQDEELATTYTTIIQDCRAEL